MSQDNTLHAIATIVEAGVTRRKRKLGKIAAIVFAVAVAAFAVAYVLAEHSSLSVAILFATLPFLISVILGVAWLAMGDPKKSRFITIVRGRRHEVVWAYAAQIEQKVELVMTVYHNVWIYCADGRGAMAPVQGDRVRELMAHLQQILPNATFGWSQQKLADFRADPGRLARAT